MAAGNINELFKEALAGDYDDDAPWQAVHALRRIGTREVFERAAEMCLSNEPFVRARGADVLAQLGKTADHPSNSFPEESYAVLTDLVQRESEARPLAAAIYGLGHLENPLALSLITRFSSHPDPEVRFAVAWTLGCFPNDPLGVKTLVRLMQDADDDVRDWATFGLGVQGDADSDEIREALVGRLNDSDEDVREEAMVGLGKRKDQRVLSALLPALGQAKTTSRPIEAAYLMLGMENAQEGWQGADYVAALRQRFSC